MNLLKMICCLLCCLSVFACSNTKQVNNSYSSQGYAQGYIGENYARTNFSAMNNTSTKKTLISDHQLMMSLLSRPMTADQMMMISFAQQRANDYATLPGFNANVNAMGVQIKGAKQITSNQANTNRPANLYMSLIEQDINAVSINAAP